MGASLLALAKSIYYFPITIMCTHLRYKSVFVAMPNTGYSILC